MTNENLTPLRRRVIDLMIEKGPQTVNDLCTNLGISYGSSRSILVKLRQAGKIERIGKGKYQIHANDQNHNSE